MKKLKQFLGAVLIIVMTVTTLTACGSGKTKEEAKNDSSVSTNDGTVTTDATDTSGEKVTLRFSWWGGDSRHEATLEAIRLFMEKNPNITIEAEYGGFDGYQQKLSTQLAGGTEPDIIQIDQPWLSTYMTQNPDFFVDLYQYEDIIDLSGFTDTFLDDFCLYNDKLIGLPTGINALNFLTNKTVLDAAGVEFGDSITWEDLIEQGKKVNAANSENYMINLDNGAFFYITRILLYQITGKPLINDDYTLGFTKDELTQAYEYTERLYNEKVIIPFEESMIFKGAPADNPKWNGNQLGGWFMWSSTANQQTWGEENAISLPYPQLEGAKDSGVLVRPATIFSVSSNSKSKEAAIKFLDFLYNDEAAILVLKDSRSIPATENGRKILEDSGLIYPATLQAVNLALENQGTPESALANNSEVGEVITTSLEKLIYKQYDAASAAEETIELMNNVLANLKASAN